MSSFKGRLVDAVIFGDCGSGADQHVAEPDRVQEEELLLRKDGLTAEGIPHAFFLDQVDIPSEDLFQLLPHLGKVPEAPRRLRFEGDEDIHVAVDPKNRPAGPSRTMPARSPSIADRRQRCGHGR
jgi:hypothetical protein